MTVITVPDDPDDESFRRRFGLPGDLASESWERDLGWRLRVNRRACQLSLSAVQRVSRGAIKGSVLGAYERGERSISAKRLWELSVFYRVPLLNLLPHAGELPPAADTGSEVRLIIRPEPMRALGGPDAQVLQRFVGTLQVDKMNFHRELHITDGELETLAAMMGCSVAVALQRLYEIGAVVKE